MAKRKGIRQQLSSLAATGNALEKQVQSLIKQSKHQMAIRKLQQGLKRDPDQVLTVTEADIWLSLGQYEFESGRYAQAETALRTALEMGLKKDAYYWIAKCLLAQDRAAAALDLLKTAFDSKDLPKDLGGCYLKLLVLNGQTEVAESLVMSQSKRFYAVHLHWLRGAIALKSGQPKTALSHFQKLKNPISPKDQAIAWSIHAHQQMENWSEAEALLPESRFGLSSHPIALQALLLHQVAVTNRAPNRFSHHYSTDLPSRNDAGLVMSALNLIEQDNVHDAAHVVIDLPESLIADYPALQSLVRPILLSAGEQARQQQELSCSALFWEEAIAAEFEPNLALNLHKAFDAIGDADAAIELLDQLFNWLRKESARNPQDWPAPRVKRTLAVMQCWRADSLTILGRSRAAEKAVETAVELAPENLEVIGRQGIVLFNKGENTAAIPLLTQALEGGSQFEEIYLSLTEALADEPAALKETRQKFGQRFGDAGAEAEVDMPRWIEALGFKNYTVMEQFVRGTSKVDPPIAAHQIFLDSADDAPSSGQKVTLDQKQALPKWDALLSSHPPEVQVEIVQAIYLIVQQHARRNKKGMAALQKSYLQKMADLSAAQVAGADVGHIMLQAIADSSAIAAVADPLLTRSVQPGLLIARAQLALRRFDFIHPLKSFVDAWLKQEPQNPLLLLAAATTHKRQTRPYEALCDKGFEIARRLQDAEALQAFREEDWWIAQDMAHRAVGPNMENMLNNPSPMDMLELVKRMAKEAFGGEIPDELMAQMLPELMAQMMGGFAGEFVEEEEDSSYEPSFEEIFRPKSLPKRSSRKKSSKKRGS